MSKRLYLFAASFAGVLGFALGGCGDPQPPQQCSPFSQYSGRVTLVGTPSGTGCDLAVTAKLDSTQRTTAQKSDNLLTFRYRIVNDAGNLVVDRYKELLYLTSVARLGTTAGYTCVDGCSAQTSPGMCDWCVVDAGGDAGYGLTFGSGGMAYAIKASDGGVAYDLRRSVGDGGSEPAYSIDDAGAVVYGMGIEEMGNVSDSGISNAGPLGRVVLVGPGGGALLRNDAGQPLAPNSDGGNTYTRYLADGTDGGVYRANLANTCLTRDPTRSFAVTPPTGSTAAQIETARVLAVAASGTMEGEAKDELCTVPTASTSYSLKEYVCMDRTRLAPVDMDIQWKDVKFVANGQLLQVAGTGMLTLKETVGSQIACTTTYRVNLVFAPNVSCTTNTDCSATALPEGTAECSAAALDAGTVSVSQNCYSGSAATPMNGSGLVPQLDAICDTVIGLCVPGPDAGVPAGFWGNSGKF